MGLLRNIKEGDWVGVKKNFQQISSTKLGPISSPKFSSLTLTDLTDHSLLISSNTGVLSSLGAAANGQIPIGSTGANPVLATITGTTNQVNIANAAGSITLSTPQDIHTGASPTLAGLTMTGTINASSGKILVEDKNNSVPTGESDGYIGVAVIGGQSRVYFAVGGVMYYIDGTIAAVPETGNPIGLLLVLTYNGL